MNSVEKKSARPETTINGEVSLILADGLRVQAGAVSDMVAALKVALPVLKESAYHELDAPRRRRMKAAYDAAACALAAATGEAA